jgi:prolyl-tRNA synthetase
MRNETRAKSGIMRCREFLMKDLYSYSKTEADHQKFYDKTTQAYLNIFNKVGLGDSTFFTYASGGTFTKFSHEFQTLTETGEDIIYLHRGKKIAINEEVLNDDVLKTVGVKRDDLERLKAAEVGNTFSFGTKKSEQLGLYYTDEHGQEKPVILGSYGIGITRLMGVIAEYFSDNKGLVWPVNVAPAKVYIARLGDSEKIVKIADELYQKLQNSGVEALYDDRDLRAGEKFADADIMGIPYRIVVSDKTLESKKYEIKNRKSDNIKLTDFNDALDILKD